MYFIANTFRYPLSNSKHILWQRFMTLLISSVPNANVSKTFACFGKPHEAVTRRSSPLSATNTGCNAIAVLTTKYHTETVDDMLVDVHVSNRCSCCGLNTKGDLELAEFLKSELLFEKECAVKQRNVLIVNGFELASQKGPWITLSKKISNEVVRVKFNVMDSLNSEEWDKGEIDELSVDEDYLVDYLPPFVVEIEKDGLENRLVLHCVYQCTVDELAVEHDIDRSFAPIEIQRAGLSRKPKTGLKEDVFYLSPICDTLHKHLLRLLSERGIDRDFSRKLVEFKQLIEHQCYITFLEQLNDFAINRPQARNWTCE